MTATAVERTAWRASGAGGALVAALGAERRPFVLVERDRLAKLAPLLSKAHIPPVLAIVALLLGAALGGILLALVAIPLAGPLLVITRRVLAPALHDWFGPAPAVERRSSAPERSRPGQPS